jgi:sugar phosphate isomerase/epimerase
MNRWRLGVFASVDAGLGVPLEVAHELHVPTVHLHAPQKASRSPRRTKELQRRLADLGVVVTCVFAGFEGESYADIATVKRTVGLVPPATRAARVAGLKEIADFAQDLGVDAIGLHLGFVPHDRSAPEYYDIVKLTRDMCDYSAARGQAIHLETGQEPVDVLLRFLADIERHSLYVNFDPANMILYGSGEPLSALEQLGPYVRSVHCKDARWSNHPGETWGREVPLGEGDVDVDAFLRTLDRIGYTGPLTIEREIPQEPGRQSSEIYQAIALLTRIRDAIASANLRGKPG